MFLQNRVTLELIHNGLHNLIDRPADFNALMFAARHTILLVASQDPSYPASTYEINIFRITIDLKTKQGGLQPISKLNYDELVVDRVQLTVALDRTVQVNWAIEVNSKICILSSTPLDRIQIKLLLLPEWTVTSFNPVPLAARHQQQSAIDIVGNPVITGRSLTWDMRVTGGNDGLMEQLSVMGNIMPGGYRSLQWQAFNRPEPISSHELQEIDPMQMVTLSCEDAAAYLDYQLVCWKLPKPRYVYPDALPRYVFLLCVFLIIFMAAGQRSPHSGGQSLLA